MRFSQFCDTAENTEQEQQLLQFMKKDDMKEVEKVFAKLAHFPIIGKIISAVVAMGNYESIAAFKETTHYENIKDWDFKIDFDKNSLMIGPNEEQKKKAKKIIALIAAIIMLVALCRKLCRLTKQLSS